MCWEPIDGANIPVVQVIYRWRISIISAIHYQNGVYIYISKWIRHHPHPHPVYVCIYIYMCMYIYICIYIYVCDMI